MRKASRRDAENAEEAYRLRDISQKVTKENEGESLLSDDRLRIFRQNEQNVQNGIIVSGTAAEPAALQRSRNPIP